MTSKYYETSTAIQVLGCYLNDPSLLEDNGKYNVRQNDFDNDFHKVIYSSLYNLYNMGTTHITTKVMEDYLHNGHESGLGIYRANNGAEWLHKVFIEADVMNFDYYYSRLKKMTLLREYDNIGFNLDWIYDPDNILDVKKKEKQAEDLDKMSLQELAETIDNKVQRVRELVVEDDVDESCQIGQGVEKLIQQLSKTPAIGYPMYDEITNKICMGARKGKFYLRSAATGTGKSRSMMADACFFSCSEYYNGKEWVDIGEPIPTVFVSVELDVGELQTMALAFIAGIQEDAILNPISLGFEERTRLEKAIQILESSELYIEYLPDYSMKDVENCIKRNIRVHHIDCVIMDYITSSMSMIQEVARASSGMKIREDQILFLLSSKLKDIAGQYNVFIMSATQINGLAREAKILDQNMLSGAKAIANRIDYGEIMMDCTPEDADSIQPLVMGLGCDMPNVKKSIYKNRRGKTNRVICWMKANKGQCKYETLFVTDYALNFIDSKDV